MRADAEIVIHFHRSSCVELVCIEHVTLFLLYLVTPNSLTCCVEDRARSRTIRRTVLRVAIQIIMV